MTEVHADMTALESRFEAELTSLPGWHNQLEGMVHAQSARLPEETKKDKIVEELMVLGV